MGQISQIGQMAGEGLSEKKNGRALTGRPPIGNDYQNDYSVFVVPAGSAVSGS